MSSSPELLVCNAVAKVTKGNKTVAIIINTTGQFMTLKRGVVVARAEPITNHLIKDPDQLDHSPMPEVNNLQTGEFDIKAPDEYQPLVKDLNTKNIDLFAQSDADLGRTETVKMKIDTGDNSHIRKRPYRTPLNKIKNISQAVDEMLAAKVIERSVSPWSFPMVIVKKADGSTVHVLINGL